MSIKQTLMKIYIRVDSNLLNIYQLNYAPKDFVHFKNIKKYCDFLSFSLFMKKQSE